MREMKDSGMPWIGKIPKDWKTDKFKYHLKRSEPRNPGNQVVLSLYRDYGIIPKDSRDDNHNVTSEDTSNYKYVQIGDFVVNKMKAWQGSVAVSNYEGIVSPAYYVYKFSDHQIYKKYLHYLLRACYKDEFMRLSGGLRVGQWDLSADGLGNTYILIPPYDEQVKIADYLDSKKERIDSIREGVEAEIEALKQYKQSVITEAVTKGLDKHAEMKDSEIPWIGKIPKNWEISRLKYILKEPMKYGANESGVAYSDALPRYIRITDINSEGKLRKDGKVSLDEDIAKRYILKDKSILFARSGGTVGKTFFYRKEYGTAAFAGYLISAVIDEDKALPEWIYYYVNSSTYWEWVNQIYTQSTIQNIGADKYSEMSIPICPNISLQRNILKLLDSKCAKIDSIIQKKQEMLANLDTYKKSLIYECVTGKKEVPAV